MKALFKRVPRNLPYKFQLINIKLISTYNKSDRTFPPETKLDILRVPSIPIPTKNG
jgi:hypothetical protein